jgi:hypothetical protein
MKNSGGKKLIFKRAKEDLKTREMDVFLLNIDAMLLPTYPRLR